MSYTDEEKAVIWWNKHIADMMSAYPLIYRDPEAIPTPSPRRIENRVSALEEEVRRLDSVIDVITLRYAVAELRATDQPAAPRIDPDDERWKEVSEAGNYAYMGSPGTHEDSTLAQTKAVIAKAIELGLVHA